MTDELKDAPEYIEYARRVLRTGQLALGDGDWVSANKNNEDSVADNGNA